MDIQPYNPQSSLLKGLQSATRLQLFPWDDYFPQMGDADVLLGSGEVYGVKSFFVRKEPFGNPYIIAAGITAALRQISELPLDHPEFQKGILDMGVTKQSADYLKEKRRLQLEVWGPQEGDIFFPNEPIISVFGPLPDLRIAEGIITEACNFPMLSTTKWHRFVRATQPGTSMEFSRRRAEDAFRAGLYAMLAGCNFTSNGDLRQFFDFALIGTMGHEWIQTFGDVRAAFEAWLTVKPHKPVGLVDTLQCLSYDFPIWLDTVEKFKEKIKATDAKVWGWRNDSGDLAELSIDQYRMFLLHPLAKDEWFLERMRIVLTNDLDEYSAEDITEQIYKATKQAGINGEDIIRRIIWAAGTKPGTCYDQPSIGGVAKLMEVNDLACIKLAMDKYGNITEKTSIPGFNFSGKIWKSDGTFAGAIIYPANDYEVDRTNGKLYSPKLKGYLDMRDVIDCRGNSALAHLLEDYTVTQSQQKIFNSRTDCGFTSEWIDPQIEDVPKRIASATAKLPWNMNRISNPQTATAYLAPTLKALRGDMIAQKVLRQDFLK